MRFELARLDDLIRRADEDQSADKNTPAPEPPPELVSLQRLVKEKQAELERLRIEYEKAKPMFSADQTSAPVVVKSSKDQEWIGLIGNRVMPIDEKHYSKKTRRSGRVVQITFTPKSRGESLEEMVRPGSEFLKLLNGINPTKELLAFYVDKNSFAMFREIRTIARKQGIETAWFPDLRGDGSIVFSTSGGASVGPQK